MKLIEGKHKETRSNLINFRLACTDQSERNRWLAKLDNSNWLFHIKEALTTACIIAQTIDCEGNIPT
jgi:hypothetical protein